MFSDILAIFSDILLSCKMNRCSKCKKPVRGHDGPCGTNCTAEPGPEIDITGSESGDENAVGDAANGGHNDQQQNLIYQQLLNQMTLLNTGMQQLLQQFQHGSVQPTPTPIQTAGLQIATGATHSTQTAASATQLTQAPPSKIQQAVRNGEFISLPDLLPELPSVSMDVSESSEKTKPVKRKITNFLTWLQAWTIYEKMAIEAHPEVYSKMADYRSLIQECDTKYNWVRVYDYDVKFRLKLASNSPDARFNFSDTDAGLFVTVLDATAVKPRKACYRCHSSNHHVAECPFLATETSMASGKEAGPSKVKAPYFQGKEVCINFQTGRCRFPSCSRAHVCQKCFDPVPLYACTRCKQGFQQPGTAQNHPYR